MDMPLYSAAVWFLLLLFSSLILRSRRLDVHHTSTHDVALARIQNAGLKCAPRCSLNIQDTKIWHLGTIAQLYRAVSSQLRHLSTIGKGLGKHQHLFHKASQYGERRPTAEIGWRVWGTPANFNGFRVLVSLLHQRRSTEVNQTLHDVWRSPGLVQYIYILGALSP